ncbi:MAG TPA: DNA polymerase III subunit epsilon [Thermohalobaculum sp.]|nr:DNA polymerase III subunit epsilon [Thermohalobaculum sp.]
MREIVWDTETTGLDFVADRIVEIGAIEIVNGLPTGEQRHYYLNPERPMPREAFAIHGLGDAFLADKPRFAEIVDDFLEFVADARLVAHNAAFDMGMLNAELRRLGRPALPTARALDTRELATARYPGAHASLDALCRRFAIDLAQRTKHGALLDSELLAEVYLQLCGGRQGGLAFEAADAAATAAATARPAAPRPRPLEPRLTEAEARAHEAFVAELGEGAVWARLAPAAERSGAA